VTRAGPGSRYRPSARPGAVRTTASVSAGPGGGPPAAAGPSNAPADVASARIPSSTAIDAVVNARLASQVRDDHARTAVTSGGVTTAEMTKLATMK